MRGIRYAWERIGWLADPFMWAFLVLMLAGALLTSHGTLTFYEYLLPQPYPWAAVVVMTGGIMLFGVAGVLDRRNRRTYLAAMSALLIIELLAQYLQGQANLMPNIRRAFPGNQSDIDLVSIATNPVGRILLPSVYLAAFSLIVVGFEIAFSSRVRTLMGRRARVNALRFLRDTRSSSVKQLVSQLKQDAQRFKNDWEQAAAQLEHARKRNADLDIRYFAEVESLRSELERAREQSAKSAPDFQTANDMGSMMRMLGEYCRTQIEAGVDPKDVARPFRVSSAIVQSWIKSSEEA
jgi:hypothetical protein